MFPQVAEIMRWPMEISAVPVFAGAFPFPVAGGTGPAVEAIITWPFYSRGEGVEQRRVE